MLLFGSCDWQQALQKPSTAPLRIWRYDRVLDEFVSLNSYSALQRMNTEFPIATKLLIEDVLAIGKVNEPRIEQRLRHYCLDSTVQVLFQDVHRTFSDVSDIQKELYQVFQALKDADPSFRIPRLYTQISALNQSIVIGDSIVGISLDKYLGADYSLYKSYYYPYQLRSMTRERIVPDVLIFYLMSEYPLREESSHAVLDHIIQCGKMNWIVARLRGNISMEEQIGFDQRHTDWCTNNATKIWEWVHKEKVLESTEITMWKMLMQPREYTEGLGDTSPDQIGLWLGIHVVDEFMKRNPNLSIGELMQMTDYRKIWLESGCAQN